ncbi:hypothetical protein KY347_05510 [Candidatus Woesearchaeota archaeon]|nr:hypothetical protein [Candidatus Woesearchaeota archaeon]
MLFIQSEWISKNYPGLSEEYNEFLKLQDINEEKLKLVQQYLKSFDEGDFKKLTKLFKRIKKLMVEDKKEEAVEKKYALRFLNRIKEGKNKEAYSQKILEETKNLIESLEKLNNNLSAQLKLVYEDQINWGLRSKFNDFIQLILDEQKIIKVDLKFLDEVKTHFSKKIDDELKENARRVEIIGHKGANGLFPGNTVASVLTALTAGAERIEFDVQLCKSGEVIVMHDYVVNTTTQGKGLVKELGWDYLRGLEVGNTGQTVPKMEDIIKKLRGKGINLNIELKAYRSSLKEMNNLVKAVGAVLVKYNMPPNRVIISSFNRDILKLVKNTMPYPIAPSFEDFGAEGWLGFKWEGLKHIIKKELVPREIVYRSFVKNTLALGSRIMQSPVDMVDGNLIKLAHDNKLKVNAWTVNNPYMMMQLIAWGVDGIITDRPDILRKVKNSLISGYVPSFLRMVRKREIPARKRYYKRGYYGPPEKNIL